MSWKALAIGFVAHPHLTRSPCMTTQVKSNQYGVSDLYCNKRHRRPRKYQYMIYLAYLASLGFLHM
jgi:hypothetical protein